MPRDDQHRNKARLNEEFAKALDKSTDTAEAWAVIIAFYAALHYVQGYFAKLGAGDCDNHRSREVEIARDPKLKYILAEYKYLYKLSHLARYKCTGLETRPYPRAEKLLGQIRGQVDKALEV